MSEPEPLGQLIHDLRSPLMVIEGFATLLTRDPAALSDEQREDYGRRIAGAAAEMRAALDQAAARDPK